MIKLRDLISERRAQEAKSFNDAIKIANKKGAGEKLQYKDKHGNPLYGNTQFYFHGVLHQVYPDDDVMGWVAFNKKTKRVRRLSDYFSSDWKKIEIATG